MEKIKELVGKNKYTVFIKNLIMRISAKDLATYSAGLTYFFVLSIFPFFIALINAINFLDIINVKNILELMDSFPLEIKEIINNFFLELNMTSSASLFSISFLLGLYSASSALNKLITIINSSYGFKENRNFLITRLLGVVFTIASILMVILLITSQVFGKIIFFRLSSYFGLEFLPMYRLWILANNLLSVFYLFLSFILLYRFAPSPDQKGLIKFKSVFWGAIFSCISIILATYLFAFYVNNSSKYSITYGSLGGIIVFLIWLYLISMISLIGNEINVLIFENKKRRTNT
ncbi:YihY/virulence factor BrkB family protein [Peptoniphilus raoultii]|uniref:YihY/virulence factor BrkB family protein n=1 Tax=Peptoniphilus raoultii TaxID=1776387 RepID=UPI0008DAC7FD|nr:YihY/virulence factor BrkB family protein [Peptoniphilus raoultii]